MKSLFAALVSLAATAALAHHAVEPPLPPLSELPSGTDGWYSPQPTDQGMYPALHMDSTYAYYAGTDSIRPFYIALVRKSDGTLTAARVLGWGGWERDLPIKDPHFRLRAQSNMRFSMQISTNVTEDIYAYLYPVRGGGTYGTPGDCHSRESKGRMRTLVSYRTGEGRATRYGTYYLGPDWYPYSYEPGWTAAADIVGILTGHQEERPWHFGKHHTPYGDSEHSCGWTQPLWFRNDDEEHPPPPLDLPSSGPSGQSGLTATERARLDRMRQVRYGGGH